MNELTVYDSEQIALIKRTIARGASDDELALFLGQCKRTGLDPFSKQIYCIQRRSQDENGKWVSKMETQVGIAGLELIADRTGNYSPGDEPVFTYDKEGRLYKATAYVKKYVQGTWIQSAASALYSEYVQLKRDGTPNRFWREKPHIMLAKCAEALALRKAFPQELSGLYIAEETGADPATVTVEQPKMIEAPPPKKNGNDKKLPEDGAALYRWLEKCDQMLCSKKLIARGQLVQFVVDVVLSENAELSENISIWPQAIFPQVVSLVRQYERQVENAHAEAAAGGERQPGEDPE